MAIFNLIKLKNMCSPCLYQSNKKIRFIIFTISGAIAMGKSSRGTICITNTSSQALLIEVTNQKY